MQSPEATSKVSASPVQDAPVTSPVVSSPVQDVPVTPPAIQSKVRFILPRLPRQTHSLNELTLNPQNHGATHESAFEPYANAIVSACTRLVQHTVKQQVTSSVAILFSSFHD